jgi:acyl carrier protein
MNKPLMPDEIRQTVLRLLGEIAPEADLTALNPGVSFRDQLDIDSMDFLNLVIMIHKTFGVEIPEADYRKYGTLDGCVGQLSDKRET